MPAGLELASSLLKGFSTYLPGLSHGLGRGRENQEGTGSARYCYSIWLRHLVMLAENRLPTQFETVAELGPGNSLGVGLAALLSGADRYYSLDQIRFAEDRRNLEVFDELIQLFKSRASIPDQTEFPEAKPLLSSYEFPDFILTAERLSQALRAERIESIRRSLLDPKAEDGAGARIVYFVPWDDSSVLQESSIDLIYSQAVLEHVDDLERTYEALAGWLKPHGILSCQIDFKCHETAAEWNGHWTYSDFVWNLIRGRRPYLLNRRPHSAHIEFLKKYGFEIVCDVRFEKASKIKQKHLASQFKSLSEEDLITSGAFIQAVKKG